MKVVLTGPECSGKTTLATQLAEHFGVSIAPEPARGSEHRRVGVRHEQERVGAVGGGGVAQLDE